jgi:hypothetical protein
MLNYQRVCFFELQKQPNLKPWWYAEQP